MLSRRQFLGAAGLGLLAAACDPMTLARRVLMAGGGGGFTPIAEKGRWIRSASNPILTASATWEGPGVLEPTVLYFGPGDWRMWYRGGGVIGPPSQMGYATSADGLSWTKYGGNPIFGRGVGGESGNVYEPCVHWDGSQFVLFYTREGTSLRWATSPDGLTWTLQGVVMALPGGYTFWGNSTIWQEGSTYKGIFDLYDGTQWRSHYASAPPASSWALGNGGNPLSTLEVAAGGLYGALQVPVLGNTKAPKLSGGLYQGWYHASTVSAILPTDIYRAYSADAITWTIVTPNPILTRLGSAYEIDQVADAHPLQVAGTSYLYYDGDDNVTSISAIKLATFAGTLDQLVAGS